MINIKGAAGPANGAINHIVIVITNCYRTVGGQGFLFSYTDVYPSSDGEAFPTVGTRCLATNLCYKDSFLESALRESSYLSESLLHSSVWRPNARPPYLAPTSECITLSDRTRISKIESTLDETT